MLTRHLLIVSDQLRDVAEMRFLRRHGFALRHARGPAEALRLLADFRPDAIVCHGAWLTRHPQYLAELHQRATALGLPLVRVAPPGTDGTATEDTAIPRPELTATIEALTRPRRRA